MCKVKILHEPINFMMMKIVLQWLTVFLIGLTSFAQEGAKIEFKTETINYGTVVKGEDSGIRYFEFTNTGDAPLLITNVRSSCGCTIPSFPKTPIAPGKSDKIEVISTSKLFAKAIRNTHEHRSISALFVGE